MALSFKKEVRTTKKRIIAKHGWTYVKIFDIIIFIVQECPLSMAISLLSTHTRMAM